LGRKKRKTGRVSQSDSMLLLKIAKELKCVLLK
jgi:hypothetical protein